VEHQIAIVKKKHYLKPLDFLQCHSIYYTFIYHSRFRHETHWTSVVNNFTHHVLKKSALKTIC